MAAPNEKFCLRWNEFESNISAAFRELRDDKDFFDVTLASDENQVQAHKVILSACSPFFRTIFRKNKHDHPLLYLKGVKHADIVAVLNFMYHGEVNVAQEQLNSFLAVAEDLKIKGLTQNDYETQPAKPPPKQDKPVMQPPPPLKRARVVKSPSFPKLNEDIEEFVPIKTEPVSISQEATSLVEAHENYSENQAGKITAEANMDITNYTDYSNYEDGYEGGMGAMKSSANTDDNKGCQEIWSKLEKNGKIIRCRICGLNKHQDFFATLINHIRKDHL